MLRRLVAVLTWVLMAHLTMVGSDFACTSHSGDLAPTSHAMTHHEHATPPSPQGRMDDAPCRTPSIPMCCQALSSCAPLMAVAQARSFGHSGIERSAQPGSESGTPRSEILAPDPPPPRV